MGSEQWLHPYCYRYCHHVSLYFVTLLWLGKESRLSLLSEITLLPFGRDVALRNVAATFFLKKWHPDFSFFGYNYIKRGDALPSSCLRRAFVVPSLFPTSQLLPQIGGKGYPKRDEIGLTSPTHLAEEPKKSGSAKPNHLKQP